MTVAELWKTYGSGKPSGRFECPITLDENGKAVVVTHIYRGYGQTRLERIEGKPLARKGFQGENVTPKDYKFLIRD